MTTGVRPIGAKSTDLTGIFLVVAAALLWSSGGLIVRLLAGVDSWTIVFWRSLSAFAFLLLLGLVTEGPRYLAALLRLRPATLAIALCYVVASISLVVALQLTSVADVLILMSCAPLLAALLGRIALGERLPALGWVALAGSILGAGIMVSDSYARGSLAGDLIAIGMTLAVATATVLFRRFREVSLLPGVNLAMLIATCVAAPLASFAPVPPGQAGLIGFFGAVQLGAGLALFAGGARLIPAAQTAMFGVIEPVLGPVWVWLALGERPSQAGLIGGMTVIGALVLFTLSTMRYGSGAK